YREALQAGLDLSVPADWTLQEITAAARSTGITARVHLKVDTGLGRGGANLDEWTRLLHEAVDLQAEGLLHVAGVWSHLARADELGHPSLQTPLADLAAASARAEAAGAALPARHLAHSARTPTAPETHCDLVRPGSAVYGLSPAPQTHPASAMGLVPAMRLEAQVHLTKDAPADQGVSYRH